MRKILLILIAFHSMAAHSQNLLKEKDVPPTILQDFKQRFPYIENLIWVQQNEQIIGASFTDRNAATKAIYQVNGEWQQTEKEIQFRDLPDSSAKFLRENYGGLTLSKVTRLTTRRYGVLYDVTAIDKIKKVLLTFEMNGGLVSTKEEVLEDRPLTPEGKEKKPGLLQMLKPQNN